MWWRAAPVVVLLLMAACGDDGPPPCPGGAVESGNDYICPGACTTVHGDGECPDGYVCTCALECVWFTNGFPLDAGPYACGLDAGVDATPPDAP